MLISKIFCDIFLLEKSPKLKKNPKQMPYSPHVQASNHDIKRF
jgi:hypothetical protein